MLVQHSKQLETLNSFVLFGFFFVLKYFRHDKYVRFIARKISSKKISLQISFIFLELGLCLIQLVGGDNKEQNVQHAIDEIRKAVAKYHPRVVALPECFNAPYGEEFFDKYAELVPNGPTCAALSAIAKELNIYLLGGSIPERDSDNPKILYNTATVWSPNGEMIAKHRKVKNVHILRLNLS